MYSDTDSAADNRDGLLARFAAAVSSLADGQLTFAAPFDFSTSAALADNIDFGDTAERLFAVTAQRQSGYTVRIFTNSSAHPDLPEREVIDTRVPSDRLLIALLEGLLEELYDRQEQE